MKQNRTDLEAIESNIPQEMKDMPHWVTWRYKEEKKPPINPKTGRFATVDNPQTWGTYRQALEAMKKGSYAGIGFMLRGSGLWCVDLDHCFEGDPEKEAAAHAIIKRLNTYAEHSPSGTGVHIWGKGKLPGPGGKPKQDIEIYGPEDPRYITITGARIGFQPISDRENEIGALYRELKPEKVTTPPAEVGLSKRTNMPPPVDDLSDSEIIDLIRISGNGPKFERLWAGDLSDHSGDHNRADLALCNMLMFYTGNNEEMTDSIFRQSGLYRDEKWERKDYRERTLKKAHQAQTYIPGGPRSSPIEDFGRAADPKKPTREKRKGITEEELAVRDYPEPRWIAKGLLSEGVAILGGKAKLGKSWMCLSLARTVAAGGHALDRFPAEKAEVLYLALEDNERRLKKRLYQMRQNEKPNPNLHFFVEWPRMDQGGIQELNDWLDDHPACKFVIVDVLGCIRRKVTGRGTLYDEDSEAIRDFKQIADQRGICILLVHHLRKASAEDILDEFSGSTGVTAAADVILRLKRDRGKMDASLYVTGREIENETEYALRFDGETGRWSVIGNADLLRISTGKTEILDAFKTLGGSGSIKEIASEIGKGYIATKTVIYRMVKEGKVKSEKRGVYTLVNDFEDPFAGEDVFS